MPYVPRFGIFPSVGNTDIPRVKSPLSFLGPSPYATSKVGLSLLCCACIVRATIDKGLQLTLGDRAARRPSPWPKQSRKFSCSSREDGGRFYLRRLRSCPASSLPGKPKHLAGGILVVPAAVHPAEAGAPAAALPATTLTGAGVPAEGRAADPGGPAAVRPEALPAGADFSADSSTTSE